MAVHTGYWGDFRELDPKPMLDVCIRRPEVRFDVFHLGMPMIRDAIPLGKSHANVTLNLCWCPVISQVQTTRALGARIDAGEMDHELALRIADGWFYDNPKRIYRLDEF